VPTRTKKLLLLLIAVVLSLVAAEVFVRLALEVPDVERITPGVQNAYELTDNPVLGYVLKRSYVHQGPAHGNRIARTNSHGFRDIERTFRKPAGSTRIILLGDSVVVGHGIETIDDTISRQLENRFAQSETVEVLNMGIGGYCTRAEAELLAVRGLAYQPDLVLLVFVYNDYTDLNGQITQYRSRRPALINELFVRSELFRNASISFDLFGFREEVVPDYRKLLNEEAIRKNNVTQGLELLKELSVEQGFELAIVAWPTFREQKIIDGPFSPTRTDQLIVEGIAGDLGIPTFRISEQFRRDFERHERQGRPSNPKQFYTTGDGMHPNPRGARLAALFIEDLIREHYGSRLARSDAG